MRCRYRCVSLIGPTRLRSQIDRDSPRYPLELLLRLITVSLKTQEIVGKLPALDL